MRKLLVYFFATIQASRRKFVHRRYEQRQSNDHCAVHFGENSSALRSSVVAGVLFTWTSRASARRSPRRDQDCVRRCTSDLDPAGSSRRTMTGRLRCARNTGCANESWRSDHRFLLPDRVHGRPGSEARQRFSCPGRKNALPPTAPCATSVNNYLIFIWICRDGHPV